MIVPMKKIAVIVQSKDAGPTVSRLRSLGVVHVEHQQPPKAKSISELRDEITLLSEAIGILSQAEFFNKKYEQNTEGLDECRLVARHIVDSSNRLKQLEEYSRGIIHKISEWEQWGDFDPSEIAQLAERGVQVRLYQVPVKEIKKFPSTAVLKIFSTHAGIANCALISREKNEVSFKEVTLPSMSLEKMRARLTQDQKVAGSIKADIRKAARHLSSLLNIKRTLEKELEFQEALNGMGASEGLVYLTGFIPDNTVELLEASAKELEWGLVVKDPDPGDSVPTLIRNPRWVSIIGSVFKVIEIVPGYNELDISLWFLIFFSIFFGILIGDAGYGAIYFVMTFLAQRKWGRRIADKSFFLLFYLLSLCAIIWGALTATFFGQEWLPQAVKPLIPALRDDKNVQSFCFSLGAAHLSIAHIWRAMIKAPSLTALVDIGWICILWAAFSLARTLILGYAFPLFANWLVIAGVTLVILFTHPQKNLFKGIGLGLGNLALSLVNNFTDIVSYIRLFAVGLASVAIADAFNRMAIGIGYNNIFTGALTSLILLFGHLLNIVLGPLSILVHGVRLNVLEFCNHLDIKWGGFVYKPLREEVR